MSKGWGGFGGVREADRVIPLGPWDLARKIDSPDRFSSASPLFKGESHIPQISLGVATVSVRSPPWKGGKVSLSKFNDSPTSDRAGAACLERNAKEQQASNTFKVFNLTLVPSRRKFIHRINFYSARALKGEGGVPTSTSAPIPTKSRG